MQYFFYLFLYIFRLRHFAHARTHKTRASLLYNLKMTELLEAAEFAKLEDGALCPASPKGLPVLLIRKGAHVFALENRCVHLGCPLAAGTLDGYTLKCPCHDWRFDVRDGRFIDAPRLRLKTYTVTIKDGKVFIREVDK